MDDFVLELELLQQLDEEGKEETKPEEETKAASPYLNVMQEWGGQLAGTLNDIDAALQAVFGDEDNGEN